VTLALQRLAVRANRWGVPVVAVVSVLLLAVVGAFNAALEDREAARQTRRPWGID
jgi:amino acid permease